MSKAEDVQKVLRRMDKREAEREKLLEALDFWTAVEMAGIDPKDVRCCGKTKRDHFIARGQSNKPFTVAILHDGRKIGLDDELTELYEARKKTISEEKRRLRDG